MNATDFVAQLSAATNAHDVEAITGCFAPEYVNQTPCHPARGFVGNEQVRRNWTTILAGVPDLVAEVLGASVDGDRVWTEWEMRGTQRDGAPHLMRGVVIFTVPDQRATAARFFLEPVDQAGDGVDEAVRRAVGGGP
jgi:ketosteroid isomerase-like protein